MRLKAGLPILALTALFAVACSDDTATKKKDQGPGDSRVDVVVTKDGGADGQPDSLQPDTLAPDGQQPDTQQPDTLQPDGPAPDAAGDQGTDLATGPDQGVDTLSPDLISPDLGSAGGLCASAPKINLVAGSATINGDTSGLTNEFGGTCQGTTGNTSSLTGAQAYYTIPGKANQWYKFVLRPSFSLAYAYAFSTPLCTDAAISTDCSSDGLTGSSTRTSASASAARAMYYQPASAADFKVAVDSSSTSSTYTGPFTLDVEQIATPTNGTCANAQQIVFFNGKATVRGDTWASMTPDEFPKVNCYTTSTSTTYDMDGPQAYFKFDAQAGQSYKITLKGEASYLQYFYVFGSTCTEAAINADCRSGGVSGEFGGTSTVSSGGSRTIAFTPATAGTYTIAVDGNSDYGAGSFILEVEEFTAPTNGTCTTPTPITLTAGKATINGTTLGTVNEYGTAISCYTTVDGPQAYYELDAQAGKSYILSLATTFSSTYWYVIQAASCGDTAAINADCNSAGVSGVEAGFASTSSTDTQAFRPAVPGKYLIVVDSTDTAYTGDFQLDVEEITAPTNEKACSATPVTFTNGKATINGTSRGAANEFGVLAADGINCDGTIVFDGPQVYYEIDVKAGKGYKIKLTPTASSTYLYTFQKGSCAARAGVDADCGSGGFSGSSVGSITANTTGELNFAPTNIGPYIVAIDTSDAAYEGGDFKLEIEEVDKAPNTTCAAATTLTLTNGEVTVNETTGFSVDEYSGLNCRNQSLGTTSATLDGAQLYYALAMNGTKGYEIELTATYNQAYFYVFDGSLACSELNIETDCISGGATGRGEGPLSANTAGKIFFQPPASGIYKIGVDSYLEAGDFTLKIKEVDVPANTTCATAKALTLSGGTVTDSATTAFAADEFATLQCTSQGGTTPSANLDGGQLYWSVTLDATKEYAISATTDFDAGFLYVVDGATACTEAALQTACQSGGTSGEGKGPISNGKGTIYFKPPTTGSYKIAIDSEGGYGNGTVEVTELAPPANGSCATAATLTLTNNAGSVSGFTVAAPDEFPGTINCGTATAFGGPQVYYKVSLTGGQQYAFILNADFAAKLYFFRGVSACTASAINGDCSSAGVNGGLAEVATGGGGAAIAFKPAASGDYYIAIDGAAGVSGGYTLAVAPGPEGLIFSEVFPGNVDYMVIKNISSAPISLGGVEMRIFENPETFANASTIFTLPQQVLAAGQSVYVVESTSIQQPGDILVPSNILINASTGFSIMLCNGPCSATNSANVLDAARFQSTATSTSPAPALPTGLSFSPGPQVGVSNDTTQAYIRTGFTGVTPAFQASDWTAGLATRP